MGDVMALHPRHDLLLVAALADRDVDQAERQRAEALVAACPPCASLAADLRVLATATRDLPPVTRPRDFRLGEADAARLRHPSPWRRLVAAFGSGRDTVSRPLALGFTTFGLAGLLVGSVPAALPGQADGGAAPESTRSGDAAAQMLHDPDTTESSTTTAAPPPVVVLSGAFLATGVGIAGLRVVAGRRRGNHPGQGPV